MIDEKGRASVFSLDHRKEIAPWIRVLWDLDHPHCPHRPVEPPTAE